MSQRATASFRRIRLRRLAPAAAGLGTFLLMLLEWQAFVAPKLPEEAFRPWMNRGEIVWSGPRIGPYRLYAHRERPSAYFRLDCSRKLVEIPNSHRAFSLSYPALLGCFLLSIVQPL